MLKAIVTDLDGTLLNSKKNISTKTKEWLVQWMKSGGVFIVATGRHIENVKGYFKHWEEQPNLITSNGVMCDYDLTFSLSNSLIEKVDKMLDIAAFHGVHISAFTDSGWHVIDVNDMVIKHDFYGKKINQEEFVKLPAFKILFYGTKEALVATKKTLLSYYPNYVISFSEENLLEVQRNGINKLSALEILLAKRGLSPKDAIAFGDGLNDLELLSGCSTGVLMSNALPELIISLPDNPVTSSNDDEGVLAYLLALQL